MQTVYLWNTFDNGEPGSNMARKNSRETSFPLCGSIRSFFYLANANRVHTPVLKDFALRSRSAEIQPRNYFTFRIRVLRARED